VPALRYIEISMTRFPPIHAMSRCRIHIALLPIVFAISLTSDGKAAISAPPPVASSADRWSYADIADLFLGAPVVTSVRIAEAIPVPQPANTATRSTTIRYYLVGDVVSLIRGTGGVSPRVSWIADVPVDSRGKPLRLKKTQMLLAALPVAGRPAELRLAARDAMVPWSAALEARVREIVASGLAADAPPRVTGISSAFHSPGNLPGEGETQVFLTTDTAQPVSIGVLRRPGQATTWSVSLGEIVDEAARVPARDTLGWYRLACFLPRTLPALAIAELSETDSAAARADYAFVIEAMGTCARTRG
jgi:hypothetical protein